MAENELQRIYREVVNPQLLTESNRQATELSLWYATELADGRGDTVYLTSDVPFDKVSWNSNARGATLQGMIEATEHGLGGTYTIASVQRTSQYYLGLTVDGVTLSETLRHSATTASNIATETINTHIRNKTNWLRLTQDLTSQRVSRGDLPQYLTRLQSAALDAGGNTRELRRLINEANRNIERLSTTGTSRQLRTAYNRVVRAVEANDVERLSQLMDDAMNRKAVYNNQRIARTELQRANAKAFKRQVMDHPEYADGNVYVKISLSSGHNVVDVCDYITGCDCYNVGEGVYPVNDAPLVPLHPNCLCLYQIVLKQDLDMRTVRFSQERTEEYLNSQSDRRRRSIESSINNTTLRSLTALPRDQVTR